MKKLLALLLLLPSVLQAGFALGLTPPLYEFSYHPGDNLSFPFTIRNDGLPTYINVSVAGPLKPYTQTSNDYFFLRGGEAREVRVNILVPELKTPGKQITEVFFTQVAPKRYGRPSEISAVVSVIGQILTRVPFKQKYAEISLRAGDVRRGSKAYFSVSFANYGSELVNKASGTIKISDVENSTSLSVQLTDLINIGSMATDTMYSEFDSGGLRAGDYVATALIDYDGIKLTDSKKFKVVDILLDILGISAPAITEGQIAKITTTVQSKWGESMEVFARISLKDSDGNPVAEATSATVKIAPFETSKIVAFVNTNNLPAGTYKLNAAVSYAGKEVQGTAELQIAPKSVQSEIKINYTYAALIVIIILLALLVVKKQNAKK